MPLWPENFEKTLKKKLKEFFLFFNLTSSFLKKENERIANYSFFYKRI